MTKKNFDKLKVFIISESVDVKYHDDYGNYWIYSYDEDGNMDAESDNGEHDSIYYEDISIYDVDIIIRYHKLLDLTEEK